MLDVSAEVKSLFQTDGVLKNIRVSFPNGEHADICNDQIIKESLKFDESISSREIVMFGLCESSQITLECVGLDASVKGMEIAVYIEIDTTGTEIPSETAEDVPFPFYRIPLGRFIIDEAKLDSKMMVRKITGYSKFSALPSYDWWTTVGWSLLSPHTDTPFVNLNIVNFIAATNQNLFKPYEATELSLSWEGHEVYISFSFNTATNHYTFAFRAWTYRAKVYDTSGEGYNSDAPWPSTQRLGRLDSIDMYDYSEELESIRSTAESLGIEQEAIACLLEVIEYCKPFNPVMMYKDNSLYVGDGFDKITDPAWWKGRHINEGEFFMLPPWISVPHYMNVIYLDSSMAEQQLGRIDFMQNTPLAGGLAISEITVTDAETQSIKVNPEQITGTSYDCYSFVRSILFLDMRNMLESWVELQGKFGRIGRDGFFELVTIAEVILDGLFPAEDLYPAEDLFPKEYGLATVDPADEEIIPNNASIDLWYEREFVEFGRLICEYTSSEILDDDGNPAQAYYDSSWGGDGQRYIYDVSNNEIIRNNTYTASEIQALLEPLLQALKKIRYYRAEVESVGLPYIEAGDQMMVYCHNQQLLVLNLSRTLSGIQSLRDKVKTD